MKFVGQLLIVPVAFLVTTVTAQAQWPLGKDASQPVVKKEESVHVTATGKFQVFISPNHKGHTFMLDTETGKMWLMKKDSLSGNFTMDRVAVEEVDKDWKPSKEKPQDSPTAK
jgi:hypothetical protein